MSDFKDLEIKKPENRNQLSEMFCLRWKVLREPWDQPKGSERDLKDKKRYKDVIPLVAISNDSIVGTIRLHRNSQEEAQLRYLAVDKKFRNKGVGRNLIKYSEEKARELGFDYLILNARKTAAEFFQKLGYKIIREGPVIFNLIEHYVMKKNIC